MKVVRDGMVRCTCVVLWLLSEVEVDLSVAVEVVREDQVEGAVRSYIRQVWKRMERVWHVVAYAGVLAKLATPDLVKKVGSTCELITRVKEKLRRHIPNSKKQG